MTKILLLPSFFFALVLGACTAAVTPSPATAPGPSPLASPLEVPAASQEASVIYHRSGGFAGTDDSWKISTAGAVSHQGPSAGAPEQLTTAQMAELTAAIRAANFMSLAQSYVPKATCCDRYLYEITVTLNGQSKTVRTIDASPTAPVELTQLIDTLNRLVTPSSPATK